MPALAIQIVRWVDDSEPGIVACEFEDAQGRRQTVVEKLPIVTDAGLDAASTYPQPGVIRCQVLTRWRDSQGYEFARISADRPDTVESTEGLSEFIVLASQLVGC